MSLTAPEPPVTERFATLVNERSHDLRTPLAVIRIQAQMLIRLAGRQPIGNSTALDRYITGLERIDEAVSSLNATLQHAVESQQRAEDHLAAAPTDQVLPDGT